MKVRIAPVVLFGFALFAIAQDKAKPAPKDLPVVRYSTPLAAAVGVKSKLTLRGTKLDTATEVKAENVPVKLLAKRKANVPNNYPADKLGESEVEIEFEIPKDFSGETLNLAVTTPGGTSEVYKLPVAKALQNEKEPNDGFEKAEELKLPARIEATIGREKDLDLFRFSGKKGQKVTIDLYASRLGSPADLILTIYDGQKQTLKIIDDVEGRADPRCEFECPADGVYFLAVMEVNDLGGAMFGYRLRAE